MKTHACLFAFLALGLPQAHGQHVPSPPPVQTTPSQMLEETQQAWPRRTSHPAISAAAPQCLAPDCLSDGQSQCCDACGCDSCLSCCGPQWYAAVNGLYMTRDRSPTVWTTADGLNPGNFLLNTRQADADWNVGGELRLGATSGGLGLELRYFELDTLEGDASARDAADNLIATFDLTGVTIGGQPAGDFYNAAREHRLFRNDDFRSLELNITLGGRSSACEMCGVTWFTGPRYFRFDETLAFAAAAGGTEFGAAGGVNEAYLDHRVKNDLYGWQLGFRSGCWLTSGLELEFAPSAGIYANDVSHRWQLNRGDGVPGFDLNQHTNDVAFLGEVDLGLAWHVTAGLAARAGYRVLFADGLALSDSQIRDPWNVPTGLDTSDSLLLHGGYAGLELRY